VRYEGKLYRALNPVFAREPLSGRGAALHGGRFNPRGLPALYCSLAVTTAIKEANQAGALQPTMLVSYEAEIEKVFDSRDEAALEALGMTAAGLADPGWRDRMRGQGKAPTQVLAEALVEQGFQALLVRSFARGALDDDLNLVFWRWGEGAPSRLVLIDDEGRLAPPSGAGT
jgi:RES domain-containing protein